MAGSEASEPKSPTQAAPRASTSDDAPTEKPKTRKERRRETKEMKKKKLEEEGPPATLKNFFVCSFPALGKCQLTDLIYSVCSVMATGLTLS
jgi:hypothetical protein